MHGMIVHIIVYKFIKNKKKHRNENNILDGNKISKHNNTKEYRDIKLSEKALRKITDIDMLLMVTYMHVKSTCCANGLIGLNHLPAIFFFLNSYVPRNSIIWIAI